MGNDLNSVLIEGRLIADPHLLFAQSSGQECRFVIACKRCYEKDDEHQEEVSCFHVSVFGRQGEVCHERLNKDRRVRVVGRLREKRCGREAGVYIIAEHVEIKPDREQGPASTGAETITIKPV